VADDPSGVYVRTGECCRCGECCYGDPFNGDLGPPEIADACPLLALHAGVYTCTDRQNTYYLSGCNVWPTHPAQIADKPGCSFRFELVS
jgi:hypothetical protein